MVNTQNWLDFIIISHKSIYELLWNLSSNASSVYHKW